jgi:hypothetical protein
MLSQGSRHSPLTQEYGAAANMVQPLQRQPVVQRVANRHTHEKGLRVAAKGVAGTAQASSCGQLQPEAKA